MIKNSAMEIPKKNGQRDKRVTYKATGVDTTQEEQGMQKVSEWVHKTFSLCPSARVKLPIGYFANVLEITPDIGIAISTDGVGTKILIAEQLERFDTIGIDCIAMNVNDVLCVGARPISMVDYIAVQKLTPSFLEKIGIGLLEGARQSGISIPAGEIAQIPEMIRGVKEGAAFDLVGTCIGVVDPNKINIGQNVKEGDIVVGLPSSGVHSNGLTLARKSLLEIGGMKLDQMVPELGRTLGEELLEPTRIYVKPILSLIDNGIDIKALVHITSDGFMNLARVEAPVGFVLDRVPQPPPIFKLIQDKGRISTEEMYTVFNMGIGFCLIVRPQDLDKTIVLLKQSGEKPIVLGDASKDPRKSVVLTKQKIIGTGHQFEALKVNTRRDT
jgi:phosphoribosylformylglycinamidine cyclo-ligase